MKITQIIKGLVKKEEEIEWRINNARSLTQIDIRIRNPNSTLEYFAAELIRDVASYDPSKVNEAQLRDDMRICFAWYSTIKEGYSAIKARVKKYKFSEQDVVTLAKKIYNEIEKRKREGKIKHEWNPDEMKKHSKELFDIISKDKLSKSQTSLVTNENQEDNTFTDIEETLPIYPGSTSDKYEALELTEFLDKWNSFVIRKPFISLVGSLANWQHTKGDIDILVKARDPSPLLEALDRAIIKLFELKEDALADVLIQVHQFIHTDSLFSNAKWRIERAFPEWTFENRISVLDDSFSGPFTNFVELADLVAVAREEKERKEMSERELKLFEHFAMLKPLHGRKKEEVYSIDSVIETIKSRKEDWFKAGIFIEIKFDGVHVQAHKKGDTVRIWTEDGSEITKNCPTLIFELKQIPGNFIIPGEMELWKEGKHQPRADCAGVLNSKETHPNQKFLRFNIFDILLVVDGFIQKVINDKPFSERIKHLDKIIDSRRIKKSKRILCHSEAEVRKAIEKVSKEEGSEGAYLKKADFIYSLKGRTNENIKYKVEISLDAMVLKKNKVAKTEKTFYYHCGLKSDSETVYCGKTFNTNIDAKVGDIIKVIFVDISGYTDPTTKKRWVNWWSPRVSMLRTDKKVPDSIDTAWKMVKATTGRFEEKKMPEIKHLEQLEAKGKRFVLQHHFRGASEHIDFRVQINHVLEGFTIAAQHADILKDELAKHWKLDKTKDVYSLSWDEELAYQLDKKENITKEPSAILKKKIFDFHVALHKDTKYWKADLETGEEKKRKGAVEGAEQVEKIFCVKKGKEPFEWLDIEGVTKPREIEPEPGGTRFYPGIFVEIDSGTYYPGAQKPYFKEYFLEGKKWKGRFVFRLVAGLKGTKAVADWLYWKPDDQSPYILSSRAIKDNWFPDEGSAMSPEWERKLPAELQFWRADKNKRAEIRKLARKYLLQKKTLSAESSHEFILTNRNWAGQLVVRGLPFEDYHLKINSKKFHLDKDPSFKVPEVGISALQFEGKEAYFKEGKKQPKTEVNPNLKISAFIEKIDSGAVEIIADEPLYLHIRFKGKKLKGLFYFRRTSRQSKFWSFKKGMQSF